MNFVRLAVKGFTLLEFLVATSIGVLICTGVFHLYSSLNQLSQRQKVIAAFSENTNFLNIFLRNKINQAGDWSCLSRSPGSLSLPVKGYDRDGAKDKLGLSIKAGTDLLQLKECIHLHGRMRYFSVVFFIAETFRFTSSHQPIYALFFKIGHHPREELITGMTKFNLFFGLWDRSHKNITAFHRSDYVLDWNDVGLVKVAYQLSSDELPIKKKGFLYAAPWRQFE